MPGLSMKRLEIDKSNSTIMIMLAITCFLVVFTAFASRALLSQRAYQSRVISEKQKAVDQLVANNKAASELSDSYRQFVSGSTNIIEGSATGKGNRDGDNARIILDALPSKYDFPALATSLDKLFTVPGVEVSSVAGTDDELNQASKVGTESTTVEIPFSLSASGSPENIQKLFNVLDRSIRPIHITKLNLSAGGGTLSVQVTAKTYYQPESIIQYQTKVVE